MTGGQLITLAASLFAIACSAGAIVATIRDYRGELVRTLKGE